MQIALPPTLSMLSCGNFRPRGRDILMFTTKSVIPRNFIYTNLYFDSCLKIISKVRLTSVVGPNSSRIAKTLGSTSVAYRFNTVASDRCLIDIDPLVFAIWDGWWQLMFKQTLGNISDICLTRVTSTQKRPKCQQEAIILIRYFRLSLRSGYTSMLWRLL